MKLAAQLTVGKMVRGLMMGWLAMVMAFNSGCASGGFKLTRQYAGFVNKQNLILRIVLYILTAIVFAVTILADVVIFNTMDFWDGKVSQGTYHYNDDGRMYAVTHKYNSGNLRESIIQVTDLTGNRHQTIALTETSNHEVEIRVDGVLKSKVKNVGELNQVYSSI